MSHWSWSLLYDFKLKHAGQVIFSIYRKIQGSVFFTLLGLQRSKSSLFKNYTFMGKVVVLFFFSIFFKAIKLFLTHKFQQNLILNFSTSHLKSGKQSQISFCCKNNEFNSFLRLSFSYILCHIISHCVFILSLLRVSLGWGWGQDNFSIFNFKF